jgi:hypothetical protein
MIVHVPKKGYQFWGKEEAKKSAILTPTLNRKLFYDGAY